jgi:hypothetical protein
MKVKTDWALSNIERSYLRSDLTREEKENLDFYMGWILSNQKTATEMLGNVKVAGITLGATLLIQNLVLLSILNNRRRAEQDGSGNGG